MQIDPFKTETWIFAGGRWKVITERGLSGLIWCAVFLAFATGTLLGVVTMKIAYEKRYVEIEKQMEGIIRDVDMLKKWHGVK